jgi:L-alanine-DL-glutamate epimerase-like enolase superfamily enzyme
MDVCSMWERMLKTSRNLGTAGLVATAIAAVDIALWDLKAKLLGTPLIRLWGELHEEVPVYGSGGFTSYTDKQLAEQFARWMDHGITMFKMKVGRDVVVDRARVRNARIVVGNHRLFVDANGAYSLKQALHEATLFRHDSGVSWLEEPLSSDNLEGLRLMRERGPAGMDIAAGEYGYTPEYFRRMLEAGAADVVQPDVTRVMGFTGFLKAAALCEAHHSPLSAHCAPSLSVQICGATSAARHIEYFHDHVRIENMLFDGVPQPQGGKLRPNSSEPGHGLRFRNHEAEQYRIA